MTTTPQPVTFDEVRDFLDGLAEPKSLLDSLRRPSTRVARSLRKLGVTGYASRSYACPVARALNGKFPGHSWSVSTVTIQGDIVLPTPEPIRAFVVRFDKHRFPELNEF